MYKLLDARLLVCDCCEKIEVVSNETLEDMISDGLVEFDNECCDCEDCQLCDEDEEEFNLIEHMQRIELELVYALANGDYEGHLALVKSLAILAEI